MRKWLRPRYWRVFDYTLDPTFRCHHVNRFGVRCFREWTYNKFCGLHNSICWDTSSQGVRHKWLGGGHR